MIPRINAIAVLVSLAATVACDSPQSTPADRLPTLSVEGPIPPLESFIPKDAIRSDVDWLGCIQSGTEAGSDAFGNRIVKIVDGEVMLDLSTFWAQGEVTMIKARRSLPDGGHAQFTFTAADSLVHVSVFTDGVRVPRRLAGASAPQYLIDLAEAMRNLPCGHSGFERTGS